MNNIKKPKYIRPPLPIVTQNAAKDSSDNDTQFELELCWCVQQLENALNSGKLSQKVADDTVKKLKILKGKTAPLIKKRQAMKAALGDYRAKMKEEEKKIVVASKQIKFTPAKTNKKSSFIKKSVVLTRGKGFNFNTNNITKNQSHENNFSKDEATKPAADSSNSNTNNLQLTSGSGFKFNFAIDEVNNATKFKELSIK